MIMHIPHTIQFFVRANVRAVLSDIEGIIPYGHCSHQAAGPVLNQVQRHHFERIPNYVLNPSVVTLIFSAHSAFSAVNETPLSIP
jgi:hypothetical protein